ncbi:UNVERIFIED_ORG: hypothetical protein ABIC97_003409 [Peribacillus simplex]
MINQEIAKEETTNLVVSSLHSGTLEEMATAAHGYLAYSGQFEVDEENIS